MVPEEASKSTNNVLILNNFYNVTFRNTNKKTNKLKSVPPFAPFRPAP